MTAIGKPPRKKSTFPGSFSDTRLRIHANVGATSARQMHALFVHLSEQQFAVSTADTRRHRKEAKRGSEHANLANKPRLDDLHGSDLHCRMPTSAPK